MAGLLQVHYTGTGKKQRKPMVIWLSLQGKRLSLLYLHVKIGIVAVGLLLLCIWGNDRMRFISESRQHKYMNLKEWWCGNNSILLPST